MEGSDFTPGPAIGDSPFPGGLALNEPGTDLCHT